MGILSWTFIASTLGFLDLIQVVTYNYYSGFYYLGCSTSCVIDLVQTYELYIIGMKLESRANKRFMNFGECDSTSRPHSLLVPTYASKQNIVI